MVGSAEGIIEIGGYKNVFFESADTHGCAYLQT